MQSDRKPLLTLAVPTYNRADFLEAWMEAAASQLIEMAQIAPGAIDLYLADNGSTDATPQVADRYAQQLLAAGVHVRPARSEENIGSDANFVRCYENAIGSYFWLCGDDDLLMPGCLRRVYDELTAAPDLDILYLTSYGFTKDHVAERTGDPFGRDRHTLHSANQVARILGAMVTFISGIVINRDRLESLPHEPPRALLGTNLTQLGWTLPLLRQHRRSVVVWQRYLAGLQGNSGGYSLARVFGEKFFALTARLLPDCPKTAAIFQDIVLRRWFPENLYATRALGHGDRYNLAEAETMLRRVAEDNWRFWVFVWPVIRLPLPLAKLWMLLGKAVNRLIYMVQVPGFWRKRS